MWEREARCRQTNSIFFPSDTTHALSHNFGFLLLLLLRSIPLGVAERPRISIYFRYSELGKLLRLSSVLRNVDDAGQDVPVPLAESLEFREPGHLRRVFFRNDLAEEAGAASTRQDGQIDGGFGVPIPGQDAAFRGAERENVTGTGEIGGKGLRVGQHSNALRPILGTDSGGDSCKPQTK